MEKGRKIMLQSRISNILQTMKRERKKIAVCKNKLMRYDNIHLADASKIRKLRPCKLRVDRTNTKKTMWLMLSFYIHDFCMVWCRCRLATISAWLDFSVFFSTRFVPFGWFTIDVENVFMQCKRAQGKKINNQAIAITIAWAIVLQVILRCRLLRKDSVAKVKLARATENNFCDSK